MPGMNDARHKAIRYLVLSDVLEWQEEWLTTLEIYKRIGTSINSFIATKSRGIVQDADGRVSVRSLQEFVRTKCGKIFFVITDEEMRLIKRLDTYLFVNVMTSYRAREDEYREFVSYGDKNHDEFMQYRSRYKRLRRILYALGYDKNGKPLSDRRHKHYTLDDIDDE